MATATILGQYTLNIDNALFEENWGNANIPISPYFATVVHQPSYAAAAAKCLEFIYPRIPTGKRVVEFFGGAGMGSTIIREILKPITHYVYDIDPRCVKHLQDNGFDAEVADAHMLALNPPKADIYFLEMNDFTGLRLSNGLWEEELESIYNNGPLAVDLADVTIKYLHANRDVYTKLFGNPIVTKEDYIYHLSKYLYNKFGYSISASGFHTGCAYHLTEPGWKEPEFSFITDRVSGFKVTR